MFRHICLLHDKMLDIYFIYYKYFVASVTEEEKYVQYFWLLIRSLIRMREVQSSLPGHAIER